MPDYEGLADWLDRLVAQQTMSRDQAAALMMEALKRFKKGETDGK